MLAAFSGGLEVVSVISIAKGLAFVFISSLVIYNLVFHSIQKVQLKDSKIAEKQIQIKNANDALAEAMEMNAAIIEKMMNAFALHKIILDDTGKPIDYIYLDVNPAFEEFTGIKREEIIGKTYREILPGREEQKFYWIGIYGDVACTGQPKRIVEYTADFDKWVAEWHTVPKRLFITAFDDITLLSDRKRI